MGDVIPIRQVNDSLRSVVAGLGDPMRDKMATATYGLTFLDDGQLAAIYKSNWLGRKIVDIPAMDAIRKGRDWQAEQDQIEAIEAEEKRLNFWGKLLEVKTKARLWGGAAMFIGTGEADLMEPLNTERIGRGGIRYLTVLSRRDMTAGPIEQDVLSEFYGRPAYYEVTGATAMVKIHPSRLVLFIGAPHGDSLLAMGPNLGWGDSILEAVYSAMKNADATAANIASLVFEANVDVFRIPEFMASLSDPTYAQRLVERFMLAATAKGVNRALILDKEEEYERKTVSFTNLPEIMQSFLQMAAGAADIPVTRLLGQSPAGMSATGESDLENYADRINSIQKLEISPALYRFDECLIRSALGSRPPEIWYEWAPLRQLSQNDVAEIAKKTAETVQILSNTGIYTAEELRTVATNEFVEQGVFPGLDQAVAETDAAGGFDLGEDDDATPPAPVPGEQQTANDAAPRTLYVRRDVLNAAEIIAHFKAQGFRTALPADDLHVTIAYSRNPVDWMAMGSAWDDEVKIPRGGPRLMERFGEARVLLFNSNMLRWRHNEMVEAGATWDHPEYQPHVTISYDPEAPDLADVKPYQGEIILGPEIFQEVKEDWQSDIEEA